MTSDRALEALHDSIMLQVVDMLHLHGKFSSKNEYYGCLIEEWEEVKDAYRTLLINWRETYSDEARDYLKGYGYDTECVREDVFHLMEECLHLLSVIDKRKD